jgi:hypothetical protein
MVNDMEKAIKENIIKLLGKKCCRIHIGSYNSLSIGFGKKIYQNNPRLNTSYYGEWEIGTYYCSWRIICESTIICGSNDTEERDDMNQKIKSINYGNIIHLDTMTSLDVRIVFNTGIVVDFLSSISDDELFHIFCPDNKCIQLKPQGVWSISQSDEHCLS